MIGLDVAALKDTLSRLSSALQRPSLAVTRWVPDGDRARLVVSLRALTELFDGVDLDTKRALIGVKTSRGLAHRPETSAALHNLSAALQRRFSTTFDEHELARLDALLDFPAPDFLSALGRSNDENSHSDVLAYLLNPRSAPGTAPAALEKLVELLPDADRWRDAVRASLARDEISVRREVQTGRFWDADPTSLERVDIVIAGRGFILAIENKLWSREHDGQTAGYWAWLQSMPGLKGGLFLSPGGNRAQCEHFSAVSYATIARCFLTDTAARTAEEEVMLSAYFKAVFRTVLTHQTRMILGGRE